MFAMAYRCPSRCCCQTIRQQVAEEIKHSGLLFNVIVSESLTFKLGNKKRKNNVSYANLRQEQGMRPNIFYPWGCPEFGVLYKHWPV